MIYEVAKGNSFNAPRGILISEDELYDWVIANGDEPIGMSVFAYKDSDRELMEGESPSIWYNQAFCPWVPIDIDKADNSDEKTLDTLRKVLFHLTDLGLREHNLKVYFSGRGYHIMIHGDCFSLPENHKDLPYVVKATMEKLATEQGFWDYIDDKVYMRTSIIRCPLSLNTKQGLFKTPLTLREAQSLSVDKIKALAKTKRLDFEFEDEYSGCGELEKYLVLNIPPIPAYTKVAEPRNRFSCIYKLLEQGAVEGSRNNTLLVLASHFMNMGIPSDITKDILLGWNNRSLDERIVIEKVEYVYEKKYKYTCKNRIMKANCSTRCHMYSSQTKVTGNIPNSLDLIEKAKQVDFVKLKKEGMQIGRQFNVTGFSVTRGEIVTLLGQTKAGKTTLMKNILYGVEFADQRKLLPMGDLRKVLYYSSEQPPDVFYFTALQMLEDCSEVYANAHREQLYDKWKQRLAMITAVGHLPNKDSLREDINEHSPEAIVIDTLEHAVKGSANEHQAMKDLMIELQQITVDTGLIVYIVSQIGRADARESKIDLFSGKGSGSIENQSRKVFAIGNDKGTNSIKNVLFLADSYAALPEEEVKLFRTKSGRFRRIMT